MQFLSANQKNHIFYRYQGHYVMSFKKNTRGPGEEDGTEIENAIT